MKIFAIIVTYKGKQWYDRCFTSLRESTYPITTIVVDNASDDGTVEFIRENYPEIILIESKENLGFGKGNNLAMRYALDHDCDYVFLLNQDTWIKPDTLSIMLPVAEKHQECGIFSPMHIRADEKSLYIEIEDGSADHANELLSDCYFQSLKDIYHFKYINAAAWLIPRQTLEIIGGFDPMFFLYGEDDNYLQRLEYHGMKVGLIPRAQIFHDHQKCNTPTSEYTKYRYWQTRLVQYLNVMNNQSIIALLCYYMRKILFSLLCFNKHQAHSYFKEFKFLLDNRNQIVKSRETNMKIGPLWL